MLCRQKPAGVAAFFGSRIVVRLDTVIPWCLDARVPIRFEWDQRKERRNRQRHGVGLDEASTVFADTLSITIPDPDHSEGEERWVTMGFSHRQRLLVVVHTEEDEQQIIRIISARPADPDERREYEEGHPRKG